MLSSALPAGTELGQTQSCAGPVSAMCSFLGWGVGYENNTRRPGSH